MPSSGSTLLAKSLVWLMEVGGQMLRSHNLAYSSTDRYTLTYILYTECPRRNGQNFGRVFLMLKYTDITQNTYVQSWTVTEIKAREKCDLFAVPRTVPGSRDVISIRCALSVLVYSWHKRVPRCDCTCKVLGNPKTTMTWVRVFL